jgi:predicted DNA binding CopG/RHH family protein
MNRLLFAVFTIRNEKNKNCFRTGHDCCGDREVSKMKKEIPKFKNEAEERLFWQQHDSSEYLDWSDAEEAILPRLKPSTRSISIRLPESMIEELKVLANKRDVPYQSLLKIFISERIDTELHQ